MICFHALGLLQQHQEKQAKIKEGVTNGLCKHLRACEQCVYFWEHEQ